MGRNMVELSPKEIEEGLLSSIRSLDDVLRCQRGLITTDSFVANEDNDHGEIYNYIVEHTVRSGEVPTDEDLKRLHGFERNGAGDLESYIERVHSADIAKKTRSVLMRNIDKITQNPKEALAKLTEALTSIQTDGVRRQVMLDRDAPQRLSMYDESRKLRKEQKTLGIPTGLATFDDHFLGWKAGELIVLFGSTGVGKSWLMMKFAVEAYDAGYKILMISPELTAEEQGYRFDALYAHKMGIGLSNSEIVAGAGDRADYVDWVNTISKEARFSVIDASDTGQALSFDDVWRYSIEFKPDLLLIDGLYLLQSNDRNKAGWETLKEGTAHLKALAQQQRLVCIVAHQPNRSAAGKKEVFSPPNLAQIGYGFGIAENANRVISMSRCQGDDMLRLFSVPKIRGSKEMTGYGVLKFNVDIGEIHEEDIEVVEEF